MTRSEELDRMTLEDKKADLLKNLDRADFVRLYSHQAVAFWQDAAQSLVAEGKVTYKFKEIDEQESCYEIRKAKPKPKKPKPKKPKKAKP